MTKGNRPTSITLPQPDPLALFIVEGYLKNPVKHWDKLAAWLLPCVIGFEKGFDWFAKKNFVAF